VLTPAHTYPRPSTRPHNLRPSTMRRPRCAQRKLRRISVLCSARALPPAMCLNKIDVNKIDTLYFTLYQLNIF
jgi:hypothetical protein